MLIKLSIVETTLGCLKFLFENFKYFWIISSFATLVKDKQAIPQVYALLFHSL